jgi:mannose-6-phosphate isomerase
VEPILLPPNQLHRFYKGGARIAALRATGNDDPYAPEEWIASMASPFGEPGLGQSVLPDGTPLADAIASAPDDYLGREHVERFGPDVAVLIKLLDAEERLPVHLHPDDSFAQAHLGSRYGKTEAWIILDAAPSAAVHVGFRSPVSEETVMRWVEQQDAESMLSALHRLPVSPGATLYVPAGTPHAIGEGILLAELQQPTDFSVLMEWEGFAIDGPAAGHLGLGFELALAALDRSVWSVDDFARATEGRTERARPGVERLFPAEADRFFRAERIRRGAAALDQEFSVLLVTDGDASLHGDGWKLGVSRGDAVLIPYAAGRCTVHGDAEILRCMPPAAPTEAP